MTEKIQLANGLNVLFHESHKSPVVSVQMWVRTGSADEKKGEEGISHFIEHLVFKGTKKFKVGEIASTVEASGGELNAYTSFDQTVFYVTISQNFSDVALEVVGEMMGFPTFDPTEIDNEREVVIEEIKRTFDNPARQASRLLFSTAYKKHPYGIPVIGYEENIRKVSRDTLVGYFESRYVPDNMYLVVVGDFDRDEMQKKVEERFGKFARHKLRPVKRLQEPSQTKGRLEVQGTKFEEALLNLAWKCPSARHKDIPALDLLAMILGQGESSRLSKHLRIEQPLVNYVGSYTYTPLDDGFFSISAGFNGANIDSLLEKLGEEILLLLTEPPSQEELDRAIVNLESEEFYSMETVDGLAQKVGHYEFLFKDPDYHEKFMEQIRAITPDDLLRVARAYLVPSTLTVTLMTPKDLKSSEKKLSDWIAQLEFGSHILNGLPAAKKSSPNAKRKGLKVAGIKTVESQTTRHQLKSGATLLIRPNFQTPTISLRSAFLGGVRAEPQNMEGLSELLSNIWTSGTKNRTEQEVMLAAEKIATSLRAFSGRNTVGLNMDLLAPFSNEAFEIFSDVLNNPLLSQTTMDREKVVMLEHIKAKYDNPSSVAIQNLMTELFGEHPYGRDDAGTKESVARISRKDLVGHFSNMISSRNLTMCVTGAIHPDEAIPIFEKATSQLPKGQKRKDEFVFAPPKETKNIFHKLDRQQSHLVIAYPGLTFQDPDRYAIQLIQSVLAGQGGRLFINLRDKASLAYSVSPLRMEGIDAGYFGAYIGCSPEKVDTALTMLRDEFNVLCETEIGDVELERSKAYLIGRHDIALQKNSAMASSILFDDVYGLHYDETFRFKEKIQSVTRGQILKLAQKIFSQKFVVSLVGPQPLKTDL